VATKQASEQPRVAAAEAVVSAKRIDGVVIGVLLGIKEDGSPLVAFPGNPE
jgi:hypothetical protein